MCVCLCVSVTVCVHVYVCVYVHVCVGGMFVGRFEFTGGFQDLMLVLEF